MPEDEYVLPDAGDDGNDERAVGGGEGDENPDDLAPLAYTYDECEIHKIVYTGVCPRCAMEGRATTTGVPEL